MQRQGYKNAASNKATRAKETTFSPSPASLLSTFLLRLTLTHLFFYSSRASSVVILPYSLTLHDIVFLSLSPLLNTLLRSTDQCSPLVTILACFARTVCPLQGPDRTLPYHSRQCNRMSSPTASSGSASTASSTAQSQYQDRLISTSTPR